MTRPSSCLRWLALLVALATAGSALALPCPTGTGSKQLFASCGAADDCCDSPCDESCSEEEHERSGCQDCSCCGLRVPASIAATGLLPPRPLDEVLGTRGSASAFEREPSGVFRPPRARS